MQGERILNILPRSIRLLIRKEVPDFVHLQEIRLRTQKPLILVYNGKEVFVERARGEPYIVTKEELREMVDYISNYSLYAYEQEMKQGFITVEGGHRVHWLGANNYIRLSCLLGLSGGSHDRPLFVSTP